MQREKGGKTKKQKLGNQSNHSVQEKYLNKSQSDVITGSDTTVPPLTFWKTPFPPVSLLKDLNFPVLYV